MNLEIRYSRRLRQIRPILAALTGACLAVGCQARKAPVQVAPSIASTNELSAALAAVAVNDVVRAHAASTRPDSTPIAKPSEVVRAAADVFGDSATVTPVVEAAAAPAAPTWDIDVRSYETQERVAYYVNLFTQTSRTRFQERLRLGTRYDTMIRAKLRAAGIPEDMTFLALVESGYDPNAYSSAAAVGMWQFMSSTARDVGLRVDWWVDERRDPARATDGAIRFLRDLQNQFGSLYLAAAAYNGGPGRVSRGLSRFAEEMEGSAGEDRFFALAEQDYLRAETKNYVPQIIAAALVGKEPVRYGFAFDTLPAYLYDSVHVTAGTALAAVAKASATGELLIKQLNPAVLRGMVPPTSSLWIRVPLNGAVATEQIATNLSELPDAHRVGYRTVKSLSTHSSASLAAKEGITAKQLAWYNPGLRTTKKGKLVAGQNVRVPTLATVSLAANVPDPAIERYGSRTVAAARSGSVHIVKRGESLGRIAARYNISVARLKSLNSMRGDKLVAGQAIRVRATAVSRTTTSKAKSGTAARKPTAVKKAPAKKSASLKKAVAIKPVAVKKASAKTPATASKVTAKKPATASMVSAKKPATVSKLSAKKPG